MDLMQAIANEVMNRYGLKIRGHVAYRSEHGLFCKTSLGGLHQLEGSEEGFVKAAADHLYRLASE